MWETLKKLYRSDNECRKMLLKDKLRATKMSKINTLTTYLTKITQVHDEMSDIREIVYDHEMVRMALNGVIEPFESLR